MPCSARTHLCSCWVCNPPSLADLVPVDFAHGTDGGDLTDTHASRGLFALRSDEASRSPEHLRGITQLARFVKMARTNGKAVPRACLDYLECVRAVNGPGETQDFTHYPGSPALLRMHQRPADRLVLAELHPAEASALQQHMMLGYVPTAKKRWRVVQDDGFATWISFVPPAERRGLVLCDPPYESESERHRVIQTLRKAHRRWCVPRLYMHAWVPADVC